MSKRPAHNTAKPPLGQRYDVSGRRLLLYAEGASSPAVVFLPGAGLTGFGYLNIHREVAKFTTSVLYDRGGTGWSDAIKMPRSAREVAQELHDLLVSAGVPPPYVLVGHSLGGVYACRFAQLFPSDVAALLLMDPAHKGYEAIPKQKPLAQVLQIFALTPVLLSIKKSYRPIFEQMFAEWPDPVRRELVEYQLRSWRKGMEEGGNSRAILEEISSGGKLPDVRLILLSSMGFDSFATMLSSEGYLRQLNIAKAEFYKEFAHSVPRGEYREVANAGHATMHTVRPDAVLAAIRDLLAATGNASQQTP